MASEALRIKTFDSFAKIFIPDKLSRQCSFDGNRGTKFVGRVVVCDDCWERIKKGE